MSEQIESTIEESPLFKHLDKDGLKSLIDASAMRTYQMGDVIIEEGGGVEHLFIVLRGRVRVWTNGPRGQVDLKQMGPGAYFGEVSLMSGNSATATVEVTLGPAEMVTIPRAELLKLIESDEKIRKMLQGVTLARAKDTIGKVFK
jgi:CRP/FNR family transcriptional regulator, cyclic AMP receptor protein